MALSLSGRSALDSVAVPACGRGAESGARACAWSVGARPGCGPACGRGAEPGARTWRALAGSPEGATRKAAQRLTRVSDCVIRFLLAAFPIRGEKQIEE